jgi:two-component system, LytTR family, sensor kinase
MKNHLDLRVTLIRTVLYVVLWWLAVLLLATLAYIPDWMRGRTWLPSDYLRWTMIEWGTLALLAPFVFWFAPRDPIEPPHRLQRLLRHFGASVMFALIAVFVGSVASTIFLPVEPPIGEQFAEFLSKHVATDFLAYWVLIAIRQAAHFYQEKSRRELQASRLQTQLARSRVQLLKMQLHPHFLFNTLHAAATLVRDDAGAAEDMLLRLADLLRAYLDDDRQEISLARELELVDLYLGIQRVRFKDRLTTRMLADEDTLDCAVPGLILQPLVENAIQHGIGKNVGADQIEIDTYRERGELFIEVRNRNSTLASNASAALRGGIGLSNSRLRLRELYGDRAQIVLEPRSSGGVVCRIRLPLRPLDTAALTVGNAA